MFKFLLAITTFIIAASAAFFSVYGLAQVFTGAMIPVIIMGSALEVGKLIAASFLYRYWNNIKFMLKSYLITAVITLMVITSTGIFGYLTAAYQKDSIPIKEITQQLEYDKNEVDRLLKRKTEIDKQIANLPNNYVNSRKQLMDSFKPELSEINAKVNTFQKQITELQSKQINTEAHIGPIIFVAKALNREPDDALFYFTLLIMCVFDPLAVALTLATNIAFKIKPTTNTEEKTSVDYKSDDLKSALSEDLQKLTDAVMKLGENKINENISAKKSILAGTRSGL